MASEQLEQGRRPGENPLGYEPVGKLLLAFSVPSVVSMLVNSVYNIVDQIFIGQGVGVLGNAATTIAFPVVTIMLAVSTMIGSGGCAYASIKMGEGDEEAAGRTLNNLFILSILAGIAMMALGLVFLEPMLRAFGAKDTVMPYAKDYTSIILIGAPFSVLSVTLSNMVRADGSPKMSMYGVIIGAVLNTILDPIYIFIFHWGVRGAAIATITSQLISAVVLALYFWKKGIHMRFDRRLMGLRGELCSRICALGISSGITQGVACIMQIVMNNSLKYYGDLSPVGGETAQAAMGIVIKIAMILGSICVGIGMGAQAILGFNRGARKFHRVRKTYLIAVITATVAITAGWVVCQMVPELILSLFGTGDQNFADFGVRCMRTYMFGIFCAGFQIVSTSYFQATGQPLKASLLSMLRQLLLLIPLLLILPTFFGLDGILYAGPIADISSGVIVALFIVPEMLKLGRLMAQEDAQRLPDR